MGGMGGGSGGVVQKVATGLGNAANTYLGYNGKQPGLQQTARQQKQPQQMLDPQLQQLIQQWQPMDTAAPNMIGTTSMRY